ncbi:MAG: hypothetical protein ACQES7_04260 [Pseudomonadota bacterium]
MLSDLDKSFIEETYEDPEWNSITIAEKIEATPYQVRGYAKYVGLRRPPRQGKKADAEGAAA